MVTPSCSLPLIQQIEERAMKIQLHGVPVELDSRDKLHARLINVGGGNLSSQSGLIIYTSITSNQECLLKRFEEIEEICETFQRTKCKSGKFFIRPNCVYAS